MTGEPKLTDRAKRALAHARDEQQRLGHPALSAEHVLLGLLGDRRGMSAFLLREMGVKEGALEDRARAELERAAPKPVIDEAAIVLAARHWAEELKQVSVGTEHLLLALIGSGSTAARWLAEAGVREVDARATTESLFATIKRRSGPTEPPTS